MAEEYGKDGTTLHIFTIERMVSGIKLIVDLVRVLDAGEAIQVHRNLFLRLFCMHCRGNPFIIYVATF